MKRREKLIKALMRYKKYLESMSDAQLQKLCPHESRYVVRYHGFKTFVCPSCMAVGSQIDGSSE